MSLLLKHFTQTQNQESSDFLSDLGQLTESLYTLVSYLLKGIMFVFRRKVLLILIERICSLRTMRK